MLRLEGRLAGPWVDELRRTCERAIGPSGKLRLDLTRVTFVDRRGVALLRGLFGPAVTVTNCSPFVAEQLRGG